MTVSLYMPAREKIITQNMHTVRNHTQYRKQFGAESLTLINSLGAEKKIKQKLKVIFEAKAVKSYLYSIPEKYAFENNLAGSKETK
jgi:hypothetical protein